MNYIIGLSLLLLWSLGFFVPYTISGFIQILLLIAFLNFLLKKTVRLIYEIRYTKNLSDQPDEI